MEEKKWSLRDILFWVGVAISLFLFYLIFSYNNDGVLAATLRDTHHR